MDYQNLLWQPPGDAQPGAMPLPGGGGQGPTPSQGPTPPQGPPASQGPAQVTSGIPPMPSVAPPVAGPMPAMPGWMGGQGGQSAMANWQTAIEPRQMAAQQQFYPQLADLTQNWQQARAESPQAWAALGQQYEDFYNRAPIERASALMQLFGQMTPWA